MIEEWKKIRNFSNYEVSSLGRVRSLDRLLKTKTGKLKIIKGKILKLQQSWDKNYYSVGLYDDLGKYCRKGVHRLVAEAFIPNPKQCEVVNHIDENKLNNCITNLEWVTLAENNLYSYKKHPERINVTEILLYTLEGNFVKKWNSISEAANFFKVKIGTLSDCLRGKSKSSCKFIWKYYYKNGLIPLKIAGYSKNSKYRKVILYDLYGNFLKVWDSMIKVRDELGINIHGINDCCKGKLNCSGNFVWKFYEENYPIKISTKFKKILLYDLEDNLLNSFNSAYEAAVSIGKPNNLGMITGCCKGTKKTAYGFKWKYAEQ